ncbi:hypothetical protein [Sediminibacillus albus]|uniref:Uncharacterized protein n=1 Tax=Sediminibacillus albus TaxID=407036 RepID=A0A1G9BUZ2_9BACI|nr:hypothetical protein [Sediminibacillus albus]SDK43180.1 hypothetical protein SAMN05216243_3144 [Sediminibacillus albus]
MKQYALLRILLACFFLYLAWPAIHQAGGTLAAYFWAGWLAFFLLVTGANLATLLRMTKPPVMEQGIDQELQAGKN